MPHDDREDPTALVLSGLSTERRLMALRVRRGRGWRRRASAVANGQWARFERAAAGSTVDLSGWRLRWLDLSTSGLARVRARARLFSFPVRLRPGSPVSPSPSSVCGTADFSFPERAVAAMLRTSPRFQESSEISPVRLCAKRIRSVSIGPVPTSSTVVVP